MNRSQREALQIMRLRICEYLAAGCSYTEAVRRARVNTDGWR